MNDPFGPAVALAAGLALLGVGTAVYQLRGLRRLAARTHVPSDEYRYLRGRYVRRLLIAAVLILTGVMIGGAYLSGMQARVDALGNPDPAAGPDAPKPVLGDADKRFAKLWGMYWVAVMVLPFVLVGLALMDSWATRRYWYAQFRQLKEDHQAKLRRDLAVYKTQKQHDRRGGTGFGGRLG